MNKHMALRNKFFIGIALVVALVAVLIIPLISSRSSEGSGFQGKTWPTSIPEGQGISSTKLAEGLLAMQKSGIPIHSLMIVRHGKVIVDAYFYPYDGSIYHDVASVTKSVMTTLIGIAAGQGKIDLDKPFVSYFPERTIANRDALKERITVRHLASNSSGLDCTAEGGEMTLQQMFASPDWVQFALDLKAIYEPGTHFSYCSPGMHLLSAVLQSATGMTALDYARANLFEPLGIRNVIWPTDPQGFSRGWGDLSMVPNEMARLGYLFMQQGRWDGKQIVPRDWVRQATRQQIETGGGENYGYGWWVPLPGDEPVYYVAEGNGGQRILVVASMDIVIVSTGGGYEWDDIVPYITQAIVDLSKPLPANPAGVKQLEAAVAQVIQPPAPQEIPPLPDTAKAMSGKTFVFEPNLLDIRSVQLDFNSTAEATFLMDIASESEPRLAVAGLDGTYRLSRSGRPVMARGTWTGEGVFVLEYSEGPGIRNYIFRNHMDGDHLVFEFNDFSKGISLSIEGQVKP